MISYDANKLQYMAFGPYFFFGFFNRGYYSKNRYFLIFSFMHIIAYGLSFLKKHREQKNLFKKKLPVGVLFHFEQKNLLKLFYIGNFLEIKFWVWLMGKLFTVDLVQVANRDDYR